MSTRLKTFLDRLISLDGGFFVGADQYEQKGPEWRDKCIALGARLSSTGQLHYDARMWGRVAAYFITSKDEKNSVRTVVRNFKTPLSYIELVVILCFRAIALPFGTEKAIFCWLTFTKSTATHRCSILTEPCPRSDVNRSGWSAFSTIDKRWTSAS